MNKLEGKRILYVEDDRDTAEVVQLILGVVGYKVEIAYTGKEGISKLDKEDFDLIILDIMLSDMSGFEVFEKVYDINEKGNKECKYAFLSILNVPLKKQEELKKKGVVKCFNKPFHKNKLIEQINSIFN